MSTPISITPFPDLAKVSNGQMIGAIEGTIATLYDPVEGVGKFGPWKLQNAVLADGGLEQRICFASDELIQSPDMKNKRIRITSQLYKNALKGLKMSEKTKDGKTHRSIDIKFPAKVEVVGATTGQPVQQPAPRPAATPSSNGYSGKPAEPVPCDLPAEARLAQWFKALRLVCEHTGQDYDEVIGNFSPSDHKEITTGLVMSFKGPYATYAPVVFAESSQLTESTERINQQFAAAAETTQRLQDDTLPENTPTDSMGWPVEAQPTWRDFTWTKYDPVTKQDKTFRLGDKSEAEIGQMLVHFQKKPPTGKVGIEMLAAVKVAVAELEAGKAGPYRDEPDDGQLPG